MPGGITFLSSTDAAIPTPPAGKVTVYFSITQGAPAYKDEFGVVHLLTGAAGSIGPVGGLGMQGEQGEPGDIILVPGIPGPTGPQGPTGPSGSGMFSSVKVNLTDAQFRALGTTPITLVAAPGAGFIIYPVGYYVVANITAGFSANPTLNIQWNGGTTFASMVGQIFSATSIHKRLIFSAFALGDSVAAETVGVNKAIEIFSGSTLTGGTTAGGFDVNFSYVTLAVP